MIGKYSDHFEYSTYDPRDTITEWSIKPDNIDSWMTVKDVNFIFVPVIQNKISKLDFYCTIYKCWLKIINSFRNIKRHICVYKPEYNDENDENALEKITFFTKIQEKTIAKNIILFILFNTQTFQYVENKYLKELTTELPDRKGITKILEKNIMHYSK